MLSLSLIVDPVRELLNAQVRHFSKLVGWANILVALGVAMEGVEFVHDAIVWIKRWRRNKSERAVLKELAEIFPADETKLKKESNSDHPRWVKRFTRVGLIVVVIGVVGEWRCGTKLEDAHNAVHEYDLAKLTEADQKAGAAKDSADKATALETALEVKAAALTHRMEIASRQLGALEQDTEIQSPRWRLLDKDAPELVEQLSPFSRQTVWTFICGAANASNDIPATDEAIETARILTGSILGKTGASWDAVAKGYRETDAFRPDLTAGFWSDCEAQMSLLQMPLFRGLKIFVNSQAPKKTRDAATELDRALSKTFPFPSAKGLLIVDVKQEQGLKEARITVEGKRVEPAFRPSYQVVRDPSAISVVIGAHPQKR